MRAALLVGLLALAPLGRAEVSGPPTRLSGTVRDAGGQPVAGAVVTLRSRAQGLCHALASAETDAQGRYEIPNARLSLSPEPGFNILEDAGSEVRERVPLMLTVSSPSLAAPGAAFDLSPTDSAHEEGFTLSPEREISARLVHPDGAPVAAARVIAVGPILRAGIPVPFGEAVTGADGSFKLHGLSGDFRGRSLRFCIAPDGEHFSCVIESSHWSSAPLQLPDQKVSIRGVVIGRVTGAPQPDVLVWLGDDVGGRDLWTTRSDSQGRFAFENIPSQRGESWGLERREFTCPERLGPHQYIGMRYQGDQDGAWTLRVPEPIEVAGQAIDTATGEPIPDLALRAWGVLPVRAVEGRTDTAGHFRLEGVLSTRRYFPSNGPPSEIEMNFDCPETGWRLAALSPYGTLQIPDVDAAQNLRLELTRGGRVEVSIVDPSGAPIPNAEVRLYTDVMEIPPGAVQPVAADAQGRVTFTVPGDRGQARVVARSPEWPLIFTEPFGPDAVSVTARAAPVVDIDLSVVDEAGRPAAGFSVFARRLLFPYHTGGVDFFETDATGHVQMRLPAVEHHFEVASDRWHQRGPIADVDIDLSGAVSPHPMTITVREPERAPVAGRVVNPAGRPIEGVLVRLADMRLPPGRPEEPLGGTPVQNELARLARSDLQFPHALTDADGRFSLSLPVNLRPFSLRIIADDYGTPQSFRSSVSGGERDLQYTLVPHVTIHASPENSAGHLDKAYVQDFFTPSGASEETAWTLFRHRQALTPGVFQPPPSNELPSTVDMTFPVEAHGRPILVLTRSLAGEVASAEFALGPEPADIDLGPQRLRPAAFLSGHVVDPEGRPISEAWVDFEDAPSPWGRRQETLSLRSVTGSDGFFSIVCLPAGRWHFVAQARDCEKRVFEVDLPHPEDVQFMLTPLPRVDVTVRVIGPEGGPAAHARVSVQSDSPFDGPQGNRREAMSDASGAAHFAQVSQGRQRISARLVHDGQRLSQSGELVVSPGSAEAVIDFSTWRRVEGRVTRGDEPARYLELAFRRDDVYSLGDCSTDSNGHYSALVPPEHLWITAVRDLVDSQVLREADITDDTHLDLQLPESSP